MFYGGLYFKFQTEDEAKRVARRLPKDMDYYVFRHKTWVRDAKSDWAPFVERDGCYVLVPGTCEVSLLEYGSSMENLKKGESLFQQISRYFVNDGNIGSFCGQCCRRTEGCFGGESIACTYDGRSLEFRIMDGWTRFCDGCTSALAAADGAGRPEPELRVIQNNPVALLDPTESCVYEGDCNLHVSYQRWGRVKDAGFKILGDNDVWDEKANAWKHVVVSPTQTIYKVRIGDKTYRLLG